MLSFATRRNEILGVDEELERGSDRCRPHRVRLFVKWNAELREWAAMVAHATFFDIWSATGFPLPKPDDDAQDRK